MVSGYRFQTRTEHSFTVLFYSRATDYRWHRSVLFFGVSVAFDSDDKLNDQRTKKREREIKREGEGDTLDSAYFGDLIASLCYFAIYNKSFRFGEVEEAGEEEIRRDMENQMHAAGIQWIRIQ